MRLPVPVLGFLLLAAGGVAASCRTTNPNSTVKDIDPAALATAQQMVAMLDKGCAQGSCHSSHNSGQLPYAQIVDFATDTNNYLACFQRDNCFNQPLDQATAQKCWTDCLQSGNAMNSDGGIFRASIRTGLVHQITVAAGGDPSLLSGSAMPTKPPAADTDISADPAKFQALAVWLGSQVSDGYAELAAVRPAPNGGGSGIGGSAGFDNTCDAPTHSNSAIAGVINSSFNMTSYVPDIQMFGCAQAWPDDPTTCLGSFQATSFADPGTPGLIVKNLRTLTGQQPTQYWTRSSADGRFASTGNKSIQDLATNGRVIPVNTQEVWDPVYAPNNKMYAWTDMICPQSPLYDPSLTGAGPNVAASGCQAQSSMGTYRSLGGLDPNQPVLAITGYYNNNPCDNSKTADGILMTASDSTPDKDSFEIDQLTVSGITPGPTIATPNEVDYQMSPAQTLLIGRFINPSNNNQQSYRVRLQSDPTNGAKSTTICMKGEKPNISFDSRFVAFHHYSDGAPQDQGTTAGVTNVFLYDLQTHQSMRVTNMPANSYACFPHFRADGWLYFLTKQYNADGSVVESVVASNAALLMKNGVQAGQTSGTATTPPPSQPASTPAAAPTGTGTSNGTGY